MARPKKTKKNWSGERGLKNADCFPFHSCLLLVPVPDQAPLHFSNGPAWYSERECPQISLPCLLSRPASFTVPVLCWMGEVFRSSQANARFPFSLAYCGALVALEFIWNSLSVLFWSRSESETMPLTRRLLLCFFLKLTPFAILDLNSAILPMSQAWEASFEADSEFSPGFCRAFWL